MFQTLGVLAILFVGIVQPIAAIQLEVRPSVSTEEHKVMDQFQKLDPSHFNGDSTVNSQNFCDRCYEILHNLGLVESKGVYFTTFQLRGPTKRWWQTYE